MIDERDLLQRTARRFAPAPGIVERVYRRRDRKRRNRRIGAGVLALVLAAVAIVSVVRAFRAVGHLTPAHEPSIAPVAACPPGSTADEPGPVDQARPSSHYSNMPMAFDRDSGRIVLLDPRAHATTTWTFDVCTNTWHRMSPDRQPRGIQRDGRLVYDADSDLTIALFGERQVWAYDLESDTWIEEGLAPIHTGGLPNIHMAYDPVSGLVVVREAVPSRSRHPYLSDFRSWLWTYDVDSDVWVEIHETIPMDQPGSQWFTDPPDWLQFVYDASVSRFVAFVPQGDTPAWTFDLPTATWSPMKAIAPSVNTAYGLGEEAVYDEAAGMTVMFSRGFVVGYDASADRWTTLYGHPWEQPGCCQPGPLNRVYHQMVYDPINERLVVYGGSVLDRTPSQTTDVWAFDVATREWTQLVAQS
jgi:hypothetical protein